MSEDLEAVVRAVVQRAVRGDMAAARLILDRLAPVRRGRPVQFTAPTSADPNGIADAFAGVLAALETGEMTPDEASTVAGVLELRRKAIETFEFDERLRALEGTQ